jgi:chorismate mutase/prephenate dehydratase
VSAHGPLTAAIPCRDVAQALGALRSGEVERAIIPWRNALGGSIHEALDEVLDGDVIVESAVAVPIRHCLAAARLQPLSEFTVVRSHPEAFRQCRTLLRRLGARREPAASTSAAAEAIATSGEPGVAVLCSPEAAVSRGLAVLVEDATDHADNATRFVVVRRSAGATRSSETTHTHTLMVLTVAHRRGALAACLEALATERVQLTHLESRPLPGRPWEVQFVLEAEGDVNQVPLARAIARLRSHALHLRILGGWSQGPAPSRAGVEVQHVPAVEVVDPSPSAPHPERLVDAAPDRPATILRIGNAVIGGDAFTLIAGPCSVESREQIHTVAAAVARSGATLLRGGAFKPRTSPYAFQGLGEEGLRLLAEAGATYGLPTVTEVMRPEQVEACARWADVLQVGARNMQNFPLLAELGGSHRPVLLKRGMSASLDELLYAAEYILARGNTQVILCERGIRTFETATRSTLDLSAIPVLRERTHLPVIVDPSHAAGVRRWVPALARAAKAVGAHGVIVEIHPDPSRALSDGPQALTLAAWDTLAQQLRA